MSRFALHLALLSAALAASAAAQARPEPYNEPLRPQVHFSPREHWMNDPNGLVFFDGEYHLFFQFNPFGDTPGHISWGHAVSRDLLHWQELPVAIPATDSELVFTGSVVIDEHNTSGLCAGGKPCMVAIYTAHHDPSPGSPRNESQSIAVSQDHGRSWTRFDGNPVLDLHMPEFRDPSVSWSDEAHAWLMAVSLPDERRVAFFTSPNLKSWTRLSTFGAPDIAPLDPKAQWECPDLLHIPGAKPGAPGIWALKVGLNPGGLQGGSGEQYFLGSFDGKQFTPSTRPGAHGWTDYGKDSYCTISYNHLPAGAKPTLIGWMDNWQYADKLPTSPWRGQMTMPRTVTFASDAAGLALHQEPVVAPLRLGPGTPIQATLAPGAPSSALQPAASLPSELTLTFTPADADSFGLRLFSDATHFTEIAFDRTTHTLVTDRARSLDSGPPNFRARTAAPLAEGRPYNLHIVLDRSSVEVFAQDGTLAMTNLILPSSPTLRIESFRKGGAQPVSLTGRFWPLSSIWTQDPSGAR